MERVILALATLLLAVIGLLPVGAMLKESSPPTAASA